MIGSNEDPRKPISLHYINKEDPTFLNQYQQAITAVVSILEDYSPHKRYPVLGFGAILPPGIEEEVSDLFFVNDPTNPDVTHPYKDPICVGVDGR